MPTPPLQEVTAIRELTLARAGEGVDDVIRGVGEEKEVGFGVWETAKEREGKRVVREVIREDWMVSKSG